MAAPSLTHLSPTLQIPSADISSTDDERLIREGEAAVEGYILDLDSARRQILPMARGLCAARRLYPATQAFGDWLQGSPYQRIGQTDRAALIKIGAHEELASQFLRIIPLVSPRAIWDRIKASPSSSISRVGRSRNSPSAPGPAAEGSPENTGTLPAPVIAPVPPAPSPASPSTNSRMTARCKFAEAPRAEEIYEIFQHKEARATLARIWCGKRGKEIWDLLVTAFDAGLLVKNDRAFSTASMWLLFPSTSAVKPYNDSLQNLQAPGADLHYLRNVLLPLMVDCRDKLMADPERPVEILKEFYENRKRAFFTRDAKPSPTIETQASTSAETSPLISSPSVASVDLLVGEIESRIEKLAQLCVGSMDIASRQRLVDRLNNHLAQMLLPDPST